MSKKLILYVSYGARDHNMGISGSARLEVGLFYWIFPIFTHNKIIKELEQKGLKSINILSVLRSYQ